MANIQEAFQANQYIVKIFKMAEYETFLFEIEKAINSKIIACTSITGGRSTAPKYKIADEKGHIYLVKDLSYNWTHEQFNSCSYLFSKTENIAKPIALLNGKNSVGIFEWIDGCELEFSSDTPKEYSIRMGCLAAKTIKSIHSTSVVFGTERPNISLEVEYYLNIIGNKKLVFPYMETIIPIMREDARSGLLSPARTYVHMDLHRGNMIYVPAEDKIKLIDCESLAIANPWRDFSYAVLLHENAEHLFWYTVLWEYFGHEIPTEFWKCSRLFCTVQFLRMLIHEKDFFPNTYLHMCEKMGSSLYRNLYKREVPYPTWVERFAPHTEAISSIRDIYL